MRYVIVITIALVLSLAPVQAFAACTTFTIMDQGRIKTCTQCCAGGHCTITCT